MNETESKLLRIARVSRPYRFGATALIAVLLLVRWISMPSVVVVTPSTQELREVWPVSTFHTGALIVDTTATIAGNVLDDNAGALRLQHDAAVNGVQLQLFELGYSNPVTAVGGLVPGSDTNPLLPNFGTFQGQGASYNKFPVGFNGQTAPLYTIDILSDEAHVTNTDWKIKIGWAGSASFDTNAGCTVAPCEGGGVYSQANLTHASGSATLIATGLHGRASITGAGVLPGDRAYSIWGEDGLVRLDGATTIGLPSTRVALTVNTDASVLQGSTTSAQAVATGTLLDLRQGAAHNYLGFSNPDATDAGIVINNVSNSGDGYLVYKRSTGWDFGSQNADAALIVTSTGSTFINSVKINGSGGETMYGGTGSPNGAQTGNPGDIYLNKSGGAGTSFYTKESGSATNTGWAAVATSSSVSGTTNTIAMFTSTNVVGNSPITYDGSSLITIPDNVSIATGTGQAALFSTKRAASTDGNNVCIGGGCQSVARLSSNADGSTLTALGISALSSNTSGSGNTAVGQAALFANTTGTLSVAVGGNALLSQTTGAYNTALGQSAMAAMIADVDNTAIGQASMLNVSAGDGNVALGVQALEGGAASQTITHSVAIGLNAAQTFTTGAGQVVAVGYQSLGAITTAVAPTALGAFSLQACTTCTASTGLGASAGPNLTTGQYNTFVGGLAGGGITTGGKNTIIGAQIGGLAAGLSNNVILGDGDGNIRLQVDNTGLVTLNGALSMSTHLIHNVVDPVVAQDAATKQYVDTHAFSGSGTASTLAMFTGPTTLGDSPVQYDGASLVFIASKGFTVGTAGASPTLEPLIVNGTITANSGLTNDFQIDPNGISFVDSVVGVACGHGSGTDETLAIGFVPNCSTGIRGTLDVETNLNTISNKDSAAIYAVKNDTVNTGSSPRASYAVSAVNSDGRGTGTGALTTYGLFADNPGNGQVNYGIYVARGGETIAAGGLTVSAGTTAVQAFTATTITGVGNLGVTGAGTFSGNITTTAGSITSPTVINFGNMQLFGGGTENDFYFPSASNQQVNIDASGNGAVNINSNRDGITNSGTGGLNVFAGNNSTTKILGISAAGNFNIAGTGVPTASHGTLSGRSTNSIGDITSIGANTSLTLTYSVAFPSVSWCFVQPNSTSVVLENIVVTNSASAPTFSCYSVATGVAANCDDFSYWCVGQ